MFIVINRRKDYLTTLEMTICLRRRINMPEKDKQHRNIGEQERKRDRNGHEVWDKRSLEESQKNYVLGAHYGNPFNNAANPNWRNQVLQTGYRDSMLNDPQRVELKNRTEDNNGNKKVMKDYPINPS
jgi:hypothetical protein